MKFVCACLRHGSEIHDGSKNACCDQGLIMPMLEDLSILKDNGQQQFREDALQLANMVKSGVKLNAEAGAWVSNIITPLVESIKAEHSGDAPVMTEMTDEEAALVEGPDEEEQPQATSYEIYMEAFTKGYTNGFEEGLLKGFDLGAKVRPTNGK